MGFVPENECSVTRSLERIAEALEKLNDQIELIRRKLP